MFQVQISSSVAAKSADVAGNRASGQPDEYDFIAGPLAAAVVAFGSFDELPEAVGPSVRSVIIIDAFFGALVFTGVLIAEGVVEVAGFEIDPDYWQFVADDPDD